MKIIKYTDELNNIQSIKVDEIYEYYDSFEISGRVYDGSIRKLATAIISENYTFTIKNKTNIKLKMTNYNQFGSGGYYFVVKIDND